MSESTQRARVCKALRRLDAVPVENPARPGTPDVNFVEGWVELKWARSWPVKEETPVRIDHYTTQQRIWLRKRWLAGRSSWLLFQVKQEWLLFRGDVAADIVGIVNREELSKAAVKHWRRGLIDQELVECLT